MKTRIIDFVKDVKFTATVTKDAWKMSRSVTKREREYSRNGCVVIDV